MDEEDENGGLSYTDEPSINGSVQDQSELPEQVGAVVLSDPNKGMYNTCFKMPRLTITASPSCVVGKFRGQELWFSR